jgi:hypothetical protein
MTTAPTINTYTMPESMYDRGRYQFIPAEVRTNGNSVAIAAGLAAVEWQWDTLTIPEWRWITVRVLGSAYSATADVTIWNADGVHDTGLSTFTSVVIHRPQADSFHTNHFQNVRWRIEGIIATLPTTQYAAVGIAPVTGEDPILGV